MKRSSPCTRPRFLLLGLLLVSTCSVVADPAGSSTGIDLVVVVDQSGSMWGHPKLHPAKNDEWQHRIGATHEIVLRLVEDVWQSSKIHRFSIIDLGDTAQVAWSNHVLRFDPKDPDAVRRETIPWLEKRIRARDLVNTNTAAALKLAASELEKMCTSEPRTGRRRVVLILTDGRAVLPSVGPAEMRNRIRLGAGRLRLLGAEIWIIGLNDADNYWLEGDGAFWESIAGDSDRARLADSASAKMPALIYEMVDDWLGTSSAGLVDDQYVCPPYQSRLTFMVNFGKPRGTIRIFDPEGFEVPRAAGGGLSVPGTYAHFAVNDPLPGTYRIEKEPDRHYLIHAETTAPQLDLLVPAGPADLEAETPIELQARRSSGDDLELLPRYPIEASLVISDSQAAPSQVPATVDDRGRITAKWTFAEAGIHRLEVRGLVVLDDGSRVDVFQAGARGAHQVEVSDQRPLWLVPHSFAPQDGITASWWSHEKPLVFELRSASGDAVDDVAKLVREPETWLRMQVVDPSGVATTPPVAMEMTPPARFQVAAPLDIDWQHTPGLANLAVLHLRILPEPGRLAEGHYLKAILLDPGFEHLRVGGDPLSLGPVMVRFPWWLCTLGLLPCLVIVALAAWMVITRLLPNLTIRRQDQARSGTVRLRLYDIGQDPTGAAAQEFPAGGRQRFKLDGKVVLKIGSDTAVADRFRLTRQPLPGRARARLEYRWRGQSKTYVTLLTAENYAALRGLPGGDSCFVALLTEGT